MSMHGVMTVEGNPKHAMYFFVWHVNVYPLVWGMTLIPGKWDPLKLAPVSISIVSLCPSTSIVVCIMVYSY